MKTVNIITSHFAPEVTAAAFRIESLAGTLAGDCRVNVFALTEAGKKSVEKYVQLSDNIFVHYVNLPSFPKSKFILRAIFETIYSFLLVRKASRYKADVTIATSPFMFVLPATVVFGRNGKLIADIRDLTWCYLPQKRFFERAIKKAVQTIMAWCIKKFDHVMVTNFSEKQWVEKNAGVKAGNISMISNGISRSRHEILSKLKIHDHQDQFIITYVGNVGKGQDLSLMIKAVSGMEKTRLNIIGEGIELKQSMKLASELNADNVIFHGKLNWKRILPVYQSSSVLFATLRPEFYSAVPSKLFEYLSTGLPLIYQGEGEARNVLVGFENVYLTSDNQEEKLKQLIFYLQNSEKVISEFNKRKIEASYIREDINKGLLDLLKVIESQNEYMEEQADEIPSELSKAAS
ncbi:MAG: glycosyltransferase [Bacteroidetes bacterium]|nr:MAG: glycosyltransferase [Bacteroidota bacterium]REK04918.1 MAG: glycosyltransferase [Bacteroidota bacterium]REK32867.1 MAG: glycosyltransferase [Bacteroidota bacterium]REK50944.1 MAG: glycosyltransferase [Bacteroidota bacterium]